MADNIKIAARQSTVAIAARQASTVARGMWASKRNPMGLRMGKGICPGAGKACQFAGVDEGCGVGKVLRKVLPKKEAFHV